MAYCEILASRVRDELIGQKYYSEKKMFGGIAFMLNGKMACGVVGDDLLVKVGKENYEENLAKDDVRVFDVTGKVMGGWVVVSGDVLYGRDSLVEWVGKGVGCCISRIS